MTGIPGHDDHEEHSRETPSREQQLPPLDQPVRDEPQHNTHGAPDGAVEADTASGGAPEDAGSELGGGPDEQDSEIPPENPSGG